MTWLYITFLFWQNADINLSQRTNLFMYADSQNKVWFSSLDGLNKFDGLQTSIYRPGRYDMLGSNIQSCCFEDSRKNIWFTSYEALHVYERETESVKYYSYRSDDDRAIPMAYRALYLYEDQLLVQAGKRILWFDVKTEAWRRKAEVNISNQNLDIDVIKNDDLYFIAANGNDTMIVVSVDFDTQIIDTLLLDKAPTQWIKSVKKEAFLFAGVDGKLLRFDLLSRELETIYKSDVAFHNLYNYQDSLLFLLTGRYIEEHSIDFKGTPKIHALGTKGNPTAVYLDRYMNLWHSIDGKGVFSKNLKKQKFGYYPFVHNGMIANARSIKQDKNGVYWYSSRDNGVGSFDANFKFIKQYNIFNKNSPSNFVLDLEFDSKGNIYSASGYDILKYDREKSEFKRIKINSAFKKLWFYDAHITQDDRILVSSSIKDGLFEIKREKQDSYHLTPILDEYPGKDMLSIFEYNDLLLIGVDVRYVYVYAPKGELYTLEKIIDIESDIKSVWEIPGSQEVYLSSDKGLFYFPEGIECDFSKVEDKKMLLDQCIYSILGSEDDLWLSTNKGLLKYDMRSEKVHQFSRADGVQGMEFNTTGAYVDTRGNFLFGGTNGINIFNPDSVLFLDYQTPIYINSILVNDEASAFQHSTNTVDGIQLPYEDNTLSFQFHGIDYSDFNAVKLQYTMSGVDEHWVSSDANKGFARYPNLAPGAYTFMAKATNSDGIWSNKIKEIDITIHPPYWQTWWFRILAFLATTAGVWFGFRVYYSRRLEKKDLELREQQLEIEKQESLQKERNRIAAEMHDDLGGGLTTIKFVSQRILRKLKDTENIELIKKIAGQSDKLVRNMNEIIWAMNSQYDDSSSLMAYLRRYASEYIQDHGIELIFTEEENSRILQLSGHQRRNILLVIKEALHNIVKHANANQVMIDVNYSDGLCIKVKDNGKGFTYQNTPGQGIKNMKVRMREIGGNIRIENSNGTRIILTLLTKVR